MESVDPRTPLPTPLNENEARGMVASDKPICDQVIAVLVARERVRYVHHAGGGDLPMRKRETDASDRVL